MSNKILCLIKEASSRLARWGAIGTASCWLFYEPETPPALREDE